MVGYVLGYDTRMVDPRPLPLLEKFVGTPLLYVVGVVKRLPQNVLAVHRLIAIDIMPIPAVERRLSKRQLSGASNIRTIFFCQFRRRQRLRQG
ncbi:hypothetical protein TNCV_1786341 [Trichonephila clavipes]|nr:hypothetical protein TNCV_1786341 [Trichonephila clavipes]